MKAPLCVFGDPQILLLTNILCKQRYVQLVCFSLYLPRFRDLVFQYILLYYAEFNRQISMKRLNVIHSDELAKRINRKAD